MVPSRSLPCSQTAFGLAILLRPCLTGSGVIEALKLSSTGRPFHDGSNDLIACVYDFAFQSQSNFGCDHETIFTDNTSPSVAFMNQQDPEDPELISASAVDAASGLVEDAVQIDYRRVNTEAWKALPTTLIQGELRARVNSEAEPAGTYEFRASASDVAGNWGSTFLRGNQTPMRLKFPLKDKIDVDAFFPGGQVRRLAEYRRPATVRGFLRDAEGRGIANQQIYVRETFDDGALVQRRSEHVRTRCKRGFPFEASCRAVTGCSSAIRGLKPLHGG